MSSAKSFPKFANRWTIEGTILTCSPLHVGDGGIDSVDRAALHGPLDKEPVHEIAAVCIDAAGRVYLPASAIKGALRARARAGTGRLSKDWERLLGSEDAAADDAEGGKLEFTDARVREAPYQPIVPQRRQAADADVLAKAECSELAALPPQWSKERLTGVLPSVAIDRQLRSAREKLLYHVEYVPPGVEFNISIAGDNLTDGDVGALLGLLKYLDPMADAGAIRLGAQTNKGWGSVRWQLDRVYRCTADDLRLEVDHHWLAPGGRSPEAPFKGSRLDSHEIQRLIVLGTPIGPARKEVCIQLDLHFRGPLLVRDPRRIKNPGEKGKDRSQDRVADAISLVDECGLPVIPAKTFHGALRAQAERVLRTLGHDVPAPYDLAGIHDAQELDLVSKVFGAPRWRAPLDVSDFKWREATEKPTYLHQDFIAIDRFSGGVHDGRKFDAKAVTNGRFSGTLRLDLTRLEHCAARDCALGLLALVLRDLAEGDVALGSKASIGFGVPVVESISVDGRPVRFETWAEAEQSVTALLATVASTTAGGA